MVGVVVGVVLVWWLVWWFSKVSTLMNSLCKVSMELTVEDLQVKRHPRVQRQGLRGTASPDVTIK